MLRISYLLLSFSISISAISDVHASKVRNSLVLKLKEQSTYSTQDTKNHRRGQSVCSAPSAGCGYGLWNEDSCECNCVPPYCFDDIFMSCAAPGTCPNAFEGCTPNVNCPYFPNPMTGLCESGPKITQGVYTIFRTAEECCTANYPGSSSCLQVPPVASPSLATAVTAAPQTKVTDPNALAPPVDTVGVFLTPIPISFHNFSSQVEINDNRRGEMAEIIQDTLTGTSDDFNVTILQVDIVDEIFSDQDQTLPLELQITVTGTRVYPAEIRAAFLNTLHGQAYEIANTLKGAWGPETYTNNVILSIGGVQTTSAPTLRPANLNGAIVVPTNPNNDDGGKEGVPIWAVVLFSILLVMLCSGLLVLQRRQDKNMDRQPPNYTSSFEEEMSCNASSSSKITAELGPSVEHALAIRSPGRIHMDQSSNRSRNADQSFNQSRGMDKGFNQSRLMNQNFNQSRQSQMDQSIIGKSINQSHRTDQSLNQSHRMDQSLNQSRQMDRVDENIKRVQQMDPVEQNNDQVRRVDQVDQNPYQHGNQGRLTAEEEQLEDGYDGGKSSFFISNTNISDESSDEEMDADESDNVLGLLYYADASSADESAKESRKSRRSGRINRSRHSSGKSTRDSSGKSSSGKSTKTKSSRSQKPRRKKKPINKSAEEPEYQQQQQQQQKRNPEAFHGNIVGESERQNAYVTKSITAGDHLNGSMVYINGTSSQNGTLDENKFIPAKYANPRGEQSAVSHGSTIRTEDSHHKSFAHNEWSRQDDHALSFNSVGECTTDLSNKPEVKF